MSGQWRQAAQAAEAAAAPAGRVRGAGNGPAHQPQPQPPPGGGAAARPAKTGWATAPGRRRRAAHTLRGPRTLVTKPDWRRASASERSAGGEGFGRWLGPFQRPAAHTQRSSKQRWNDRTTCKAQQHTCMPAAAWAAAPPRRARDAPPPLPLAASPSHIHAPAAPASVARQGRRVTWQDWRRPAAAAATPCRHRTAGGAGHNCTLCQASTTSALISPSSRPQQGSIAGCRLPVPSWAASCTVPSREAPSPARLLPRRLPAAVQPRLGGLPPSGSADRSCKRVCSRISAPGAHPAPGGCGRQPGSHLQHVWRHLATSYDRPSGVDCRRQRLRGQEGGCCPLIHTPLPPLPLLQV